MNVSATPLQSPKPPVKLTFELSPEEAKALVAVIGPSSNSGQAKGFGLSSDDPQFRIMNTFLYRTYQALEHHV